MLLSGSTVEGEEGLANAGESLACGVLLHLESSLSEFVNWEYLLALFLIDAYVILEAEGLLLSDALPDLFRLQVLQLSELSEQQSSHVLQIDVDVLE